jgi:RNA polymerase sigma factor (sigma-70 family)
LRQSIIRLYQDNNLALLQNRLLIARFNQGDVQALQVIYDLYKKDMMTLATALLFDKTLAEDVLHEVFAKLIGLQSRLRIRSTLRGYLLQAVANEARTINRAKVRKDPANVDELCNSHRSVDRPEHTVMLAEERQRLDTALGELPYEQREVVLLRHYGQLRFIAIAKHQGVSMSAVQARYRYGLKKLRSLLGGDL